MRSEIADPRIEEEARRCAEILKKGGVLAYPAETVWGLGCDARNEEAVRSIYDIKKRSDSKALITLVHDYRTLQQVVAEIPPIAEEVMEMTEGALTIIYPKATPQYAHLASEDGRIGVRMVKNGFPLRILKKFNRALISTSANISGAKTSGAYEEIEEEILDQVDGIADPSIDYHLSGKSSRIMMVDMNGTIKILR